MATSLKDILDATTAFVAQHPERARVTVAADCELGPGSIVEVRTGRHLVRVDLARRLGGEGAAPSPAQHALLALGTCLALGHRTWSTTLGIAFDRVAVEVRADLDARGALGIGDGLRPGFDVVRMTVRIVGAEPVDRYVELHRLAVAHSSVLDVFADPVPVITELEVSR